MIQHGQRVLPEHGINLFLRFLGTDTLDLPGAQVRDDTFLAGYNHFIEALDFKLDAMLGASGANVRAYHSADYLPSARQ